MKVSDHSVQTDTFLKVLEMDIDLNSIPQTQTNYSAVTMSRKAFV
jgi:hypothetical protein